MPVWLSLFIAVVGTVGFFAGLYALVIALVEGKRTKGKPRLKIGAGSRPGTFTYWVEWEPETFAIQVYRMRLMVFNPDGLIKEAVMTVTHDPVLKAPFAQEVEVTPDIKSIIDDVRVNRNAMFTFDFRTIEEFTGHVSFRLAKARKLAQGQGPKPPKRLNQLKAGVADSAPVMTLDFSELTERRKKLRELEAAAKAKAAKAPPKPAVAAAAGAPAAAPAPAPAVKPAVAPAPAPVAKAAPAPAVPTPTPTPTPTPKAAPAPAPAAPAAAKPAPPAAETKPVQDKPPQDKPTGSVRPETKLESSMKAKGEIPSIKAVIAQSKAKEKAEKEE